MIKHVRDLYLNKFYKEPKHIYFSPGRVNIIGEHTDYTGGLVMPFCIDKGIYGAIEKIEDLRINIYSENYTILGIIEIDLLDLPEKLENNFSDYLVGVIKELNKNNYKLKQGYNIVLTSNLPIGGGLSSSAALSLLLLRMLNDFENFNLSDLAIVKMAKSVENNYLKVNCGIMDQFAIMFSKENRAIYLDTFDLTYDYVKLDFKDYELVIINSNTTRKLADSKYNERQAETKEILAILNENMKVDHLGELEENELSTYLDFIVDETLRKRLKHIITENARVKHAKVALELNNPYHLGDLLNASHKSLKDDYEVSTAILDDLVNIAIKSGALGSRMVGGGFGGSTLNLVLKDNLESFIEKFKEEYHKRYDTNFVYSILQAKDGIKQID
ncbi:MAG: galactokinase [Candidatus Izemoplasmatales bacterium]|jgi:galactokinase|nr:galactokinase [Candidatus Izemoplasmatales bacterium]